MTCKAIGWMIVAGGLLVSQALTAEPGSGKQDERKGPLASLPSVPGPHIQKIKAMADNTWLKLGVPAADPKWGTARGRSWAAIMPYAPELRAAFLYGEGVHGWYNKQNNRYM